MKTIVFGEMLTIDFGGIDVSREDPWNEYSETEREYMVQHVQASWDVPIDIEDLLLTCEDYTVKYQNSRGAHVYARELGSSEAMDMHVYNVDDNVVIGTTRNAYKGSDYIVVIVGITRQELVACDINVETKESIIIDKNYHPLGKIQQGRPA